MVLLEVRSERKRRGWTRERLAAEANVSLPTISAAEAGRNISLETVFKLAGAFERSPVAAEAEVAV